ncbi:MAG: hypothetical protein U0Z44_10445 [Kouleothrix sp.]
MPIALIVHGGAWNIPDDEVAAARRLLRGATSGLAGARAGRQCARGTRDAYSDGQGGRRAADALFGLRPDEICMIEESVRGECKDGAA